jgi:hypothetical protein
LREVFIVEAFEEIHLRRTVDTPLGTIELYSARRR